MKTLKFSANLVPLIRSGEKTSTWRVHDDKELERGDELLLIEKESGEVFGKAIITDMQKRTFATLTEADLIGHERYSSEEVMYAEYRKYYGDSIGPDTEIKLLTLSFVET